MGANGVGTDRGIYSLPADTEGAISTPCDAADVVARQTPRDSSSALPVRPRKGFIAQWCVQASLPYRAPMDVNWPGEECTVWMRKSHDTTVCVSSGACSERALDEPCSADAHMAAAQRARSCGLPWGSYPRLLLAWMATEVARTESRNVELGNSVAEFFDKLGLVPTGGERGTITAVKDQLNRLMNATIKVQHRQNVAEKHGCHVVLGTQNSAGSEAWWRVKTDGQRSLWQPTIELSGDFYNLLRVRPIEIELAMINALSRSPLAIDVYFWMCSYRDQTDRTAVVSWSELFTQFGSQSSRHKFVENFRRAVRSVCSYETRVHIEVDRHGIFVTRQ